MIHVMFSDMLMKANSAPFHFNVDVIKHNCETWPIRVADKKMLAVFDNVSIRRILYCGAEIAYQWQN